MTRDRQLVANRQNALLSTGRRTPAGKDISRWNALRHGPQAETVRLSGEDPDVYNTFRQALVSELQPASEMEAVLVDRIVRTAWRLRRLARVEAGLFVRNHYDLLADRAREKAGTYQQGELDELPHSPMALPK